MRSVNYLKQFLCVSLLIAVVLLLSACSARTASEKEIKDEISLFESFNESGLSITSYSETKRKTDKKSNSDTVWVSVIAQNEIIEYRASYVLEYTKYNNGWILDEIFREETSLSALNFVENETIKNDILEMNSTLIDTYKLTNIDIEEPVIMQSDSSDITGAPFVFYTLNCTAENDDAYFNGSFTISYEMSLYNGWEVICAEMIGYSYSAKESPSKSLISDELSRFSGTCTLVSENKVNDNKYVYYYSESDSNSCNNLTITWSDTLTFEFDLINGWVASDIQSDFENVDVDFAGKWQYKDGDEHFDMTVKSSSIKEISISYNFLFKETHVWGKEQTCELSTNGKTVKKEWTYTYDPKNLCITFITTERIFNIKWDGGLSEKDYYLEYRAYIAELNGTSGFYVDDRLLTKAS